MGAQNGGVVRSTPKGSIDPAALDVRRRIGESERHRQLRLLAAVEFLARRKRRQQRANGEK